MEIKSFTFRKQANYDSNPGRWVGKVEFTSETGNCEIPVIMEFSQRATNQIAEILTKHLADSQSPAIDMPKD